MSLIEHSANTLSFNTENKSSISPNTSLKQSNHAFSTNAVEAVYAIAHQNSIHYRTRKLLLL